MPRSRVLSRDTQPIPGTGRRRPQLTELIDEEFLTSIGWDPDAAVIRLPAHHPVLGRITCPVVDCGAAAGMSARGVCANCYHRWRRNPDRRAG